VHDSVQSSNEIDLIDSLGSKAKHVVELKSLETFGDVVVLVFPYTGVPLALAKLSFNDAISCFRQCLQAVKYLHTNGVLHRDLSPWNVLWRQDSKSATLIDLEHGADTVQGTKEWLTVETGTNGYLAPELQKGGSQTFQSDAWALGVVMLEMFLHRIGIFADTKPSRTRLTELRNQFYSTYQNATKKLNRDIWGTLRRLLRIDPTLRQSVPEVLDRLDFVSPEKIHWLRKMH